MTCGRREQGLQHGRLGLEVGLSALPEVLSLLDNAIDNCVLQWMKKKAQFKLVVMTRPNFL